jgi:hypothetical protein
MKKFNRSSYGDWYEARNNIRNASCFVALIIGCVLSGQAIAESISSDDFESHALGALSGGGGGQRVE